MEAGSSAPEHPAINTLLTSSQALKMSPSPPLSPRIMVQKLHLVFQNYSSASSDACVRNTLLKQLAVYKYISILASTAVGVCRVDIHFGYDLEFSEVWNELVRMKSHRF